MRDASEHKTLCDPIGGTTTKPALLGRAWAEPQVSHNVNKQCLLLHSVFDVATKILKLLPVADAKITDT